MTVLSDLCAAPVAAGDGVPLGIDGYDGWRFVVRIALVPDGSILPFILGQSVLGGPRWRDVTGDVQGLSWGRGGSPAQRPIAGQLNMRLHNVDKTWSPWQSSYYGPGTLTQVVIGNGDNQSLWGVGAQSRPQFTGLVESWDEASAGLEAYEWVDIVAWENLSLLAEVDDNALAGVVGGGETLVERVARLMTKAAWQFPTDVVTTPPATFQSTDLAQNVATELYRTLDSIDATVWPGKDGTLKIRDRSVGSGVKRVVDHGDRNPDAFKTANNAERILSSVDLARIGGTTVTYTNTGIAGRYQRRTTGRTDLNTVAEPGDADLERVATAMLARARQTWRPVSISVESGQGAGPATLLIDSDLTDRLTLTSGPITFTNYAICSFNHNATVSAAGVYWSGTIGFDIEADSGWYEGEPTGANVGVARVGRSRVGFGAETIYVTPALVGQARVERARVGVAA